MLDFHVHLGKSSSGNDYTVDDLIENMDKYGIEKSGLSMLNGTDTRVLNDKVFAAWQKYPNRIIPFAYINPRESFVLEEVNRCLGELKMKGVKFHSWKCGYSPDNNEMLDKVIKEIEKYNVPILTHTGTAPLSLPQQWAEVAKKHPNVNFVFAHIGYLDYGYGCVESVKKLDNVYVDTSGQVEVQILEKALNDLGSKRVIFGSDWPYKFVKSEIVKFEVLDLDKEQKEDIFNNNMRRLLKL